MSRQSRRVAAVVVITSLSLLIAGLPLATATAGPALSVTARFASPTGSSTADCSSSEPCDIVTAINGATSGGSVVLLRGTYGSATAPITTPMGNSDLDVTLSGQSAISPPVIYTGSTSSGIRLGGGATISHVTIVSTDPGAGLVLVHGIADHVTVIGDGSSESSGACTIYGMLIDSLCVQHGAGAAAVSTSTGADQSTTLINVTAVAPGAGGVGVFLAEGGSSSSTLTASLSMTNTIARGTETDVVAEATIAGDEADLTTSHCDFATLAKVGLGEVTVTGGHGDLKAKPIFSNAGNGRYTEKVTSPTVDAGAATAKGDTDLNGLPRSLGKAPDIGAFEFAPTPTVRHLTISKVKAHSFKATVTVNPHGLPTHAVLSVTVHGGLAAFVHAAGSSNGARTVHITAEKLDPHTAYPVKVRASNAGGRSEPITTHVTTKG